MWEFHNISSQSSPFLNGSTTFLLLFSISKDGRTPQRNQMIQDTCFRTFTLLALSQCNHQINHQSCISGLTGAGFLWDLLSKCIKDPNQPTDLPKTSTHSCIEQLLSIAQGEDCLTWASLTLGISPALTGFWSAVYQISLTQEAFISIRSAHAFRFLRFS